MKYTSYHSHQSLRDNCKFAHLISSARRYNSAVLRYAHARAFTNMGLLNSLIPLATQVQYQEKQNPSEACTLYIDTHKCLGWLRVDMNGENVWSCAASTKDPTCPKYNYN